MRSPGAPTASCCRSRPRSARRRSRPPWCTSGRGAPGAPQRRSCRPSAPKRRRRGPGGGSASWTHAPPAPFFSSGFHVNTLRETDGTWDNGQEHA
eukprot:3175409-Prymnesium_polylepis.1